MTNKRLVQLQNDLQELLVYTNQSYPQFANAVSVRVKSLNDTIGKMRDTPPTPKEEPKPKQKPGPQTDTIEA